MSLGQLIIVRTKRNLSGKFEWYAIVKHGTGQTIRKKSFEAAAVDEEIHRKYSPPLGGAHQREKMEPKVERMATEP